MQLSLTKRFSIALCKCEILLNPLFNFSWDFITTRTDEVLQSFRMGVERSVWPASTRKYNKWIGASLPSTALPVESGVSAVVRL